MPNDGKRTIEFEIAAGYTVEASSAAIAFLWSNWDVLYAFRPQHIRAFVTLNDKGFGDISSGEGSRWHAKGLGGKGDWWLERSEIGVQHGRFVYFTMARSLRCPIQAKTIMEYYRVDDKRISYHGKGIAALPKVFFPLHPILRGLASRIALYINRIGGEVAAEITRQPEKVAKVVNEDAFRAYQRFIDEEQEIKAGKRSSLKIFTAENHLPAHCDDDLVRLEKKLEKIELLLQSLHSKIVNIDEYRASLMVFSQDYNLALVKNRMIVGKIVEIVYGKEVHENRRKLDLAGRLQELRKKSLNVPERILALMMLVDNLGDEVSHAALGGIFASSLYAISFESTLGITEWFFTEYLSKGAAIEHC